ncbi:MAG: hypothetical protein JST73_02360 [Actinobacteria bacterium]|nr:hypothetical protein [Actinomycetota bacterium]
MSICQETRRTILDENPPGDLTCAIVLAAGDLSVHRGSGDPEQRARLLHVGRVLAAVATVPGTERLIRISHDAHSTTLVTEPVPGEHLRGNQPTHRYRPTFIGLLVILDGLHTHGVTHGPIDAADVFVDTADNPTLCNFEHGSLRSGESAEAWADRCRSDLLAVGRLIDQIVRGTRIGSPTRIADRLERHRLGRIASAIGSGRIQSTSDAIAALDHRGRIPDPAGRRHPRRAGPNRSRFTRRITRVAVSTALIVTSGLLSTAGTYRWTRSIPPTPVAPITGPDR